MAGCVSLSQTVEKVAERVLSGEKHIPIMYRQTVGAETENATAMGHKDLRIVGSGGAEGDRTPDLGLAKPALSQLSYCPTNYRCAETSSALVFRRPMRRRCLGRTARRRPRGPLLRGEARRLRR